MEWKFSMVWNSLVSRSTTKSDDVPAILANLMGLVGWQRAVVQKQDLMKSVLVSQQQLPLALLYIETERYDPGVAVSPQGLRKDRWVPLAPYRSEMFVPVVAAHLRVLEDGLRFPPHNPTSMWHAFEVERPGSDAWLFTAGGLMIHASLRAREQRPPPGRVLLVLDQNLDRAFEAAGDSRVRRKGCCLLITGEKDSIVHTTYLAPIDWTKYDISSFQDAEGARPSVGKLFDFSKKEIHIDSGMLRDISSL